MGLPARLLAAGAGAGWRGLRRLARRTGADEAIERAVDSGVDRALQSPAVERTAVRVLDSDLVERLWDRLLESDEAQRLVERIARAPEVRSAIAYQGVGLLADLGRELRRAARRLDSAVERPARRLANRERRPGPTPYAGGVSRALALALDAVILNAGFIVASTVIALAASVIAGTGEGVSVQVALAGGVVWAWASSLYLVAFWTLTGQTPGMRVMRLRLFALDGSRPTIRLSVRRLIGMILSALPAMLGFLSVLANEQRRGLHDRLGRTVVLYLPEDAAAAPPARPVGAPPVARS